MYVVLLRFGPNRAQAPTLMESHNAWIGRGIADGVFAVVGSLAPNLGGAIVAHGTARPALEQRIAEDPFVAAGVVTPEILEISPTRVDDRLAFLAG